MKARPRTSSAAPPVSTLIEVHMDERKALAKQAARMRRLRDAFVTIGMRLFSNETNLWSSGFSNQSCVELSYVNVPWHQARGFTNVTYLEDRGAPSSTEGSIAGLWSTMKGMY